MTAMEDRIKLMDDVLANITRLLLAEPVISNLIRDRLLEEDGNIVPDNYYPYGEVISTYKGKGQFESSGFRDVKLRCIIRWYTDKLDGGDGKNDLKKLTAATEVILEQNFQSDPWHDTEWKDTNLDGIIIDKEGEPSERFADVIFEFFVQVRRN